MTLRRLILRCKPNMLDLQETKLSSIDVSFLLCFHPSSGLFGGLLSLWDPSVFSGHILDLNFRCISVIFSGLANLFWCLSIVYWLNVPGEKEGFLNSLSSTISRVGVP
ncbi:hypothetical protein AMTRI_Chr02g222150 [Amborella trichopoda]